MRDAALILLGVIGILAGTVAAGSVSLFMSGLFWTPLALCAVTVVAVSISRQTDTAAARDPRTRAHESLRVLVLTIGIGLMASSLFLRIVTYNTPAIDLIPPTGASVAGFFMTLTGWHALRLLRIRQEALQEVPDG